MNTNSIHRFRLACLLFAGLSLLAASKRTEAQSYPPVWNNTSKYAAGDMVTDYGNVYRCIKAVSTPYLDPSKSYGNWELNEVRNNTTLLIGTGQPFPTLAIAWTYALNCRVAQGVYLHLSISTAKGNFTENFSGPMSLDHGSAAGISILGDNLNNISLNFPGNAFTIDSGNTFGSLSQLTLNQGGYDGIYATQNAAISDINNVFFNGANYDIFADSGSNVTCGAGLQFSGFYGAVVWAQYGASVSISSLNVEGYSGIQETEVPCLAASFGAHIMTQNATIKYLLHAAYAFEGGIVDIMGSTVDGCDSAAYATTKGHICAANVVFSDNSSVDMTATNAGTIDGTGSTYMFKSANGSSDGSYIFT